jgi:hypothetical protein
MEVQYVHGVLEVGISERGKVTFDSLFFVKVDVAKAMKEIE